MNRRIPRKRVRIVQITVTNPDGTTEEVDAKECTKCGEVKALTEFYISNRKGLGGRVSICVSCSKKTNRFIPIPKTEVKSDGGLLKKSCSMCLELKPLDDFAKNPSGVLGLHAQCKNCMSVKRNKSGVRRVRGHELARVKGEIYRKCNKCEEIKEIRNFSKRAELAKIPYHTVCNECKRPGANAAKQRRRAMEQQLPQKWTEREANLVRIKFLDRCVLTGDVVEVDLDHLIPLKWGCGGSYVGNMVPLQSSLNTSKSDEHIYEWFEANRQRFELDQARFDAMISVIAAQNGLTPEEYREFYDWCFANKRTIAETERDNETYGFRVTSVELWRDRTGRHLTYGRSR